MRITRNNYEIFFLDFHEGRLSPDLRADLMAFLNRNPDLKDEFHSFETGTGIGQDQPAVSFPSKEKLYKDHVPVGRINPDNIDEMIIASMEHDLDEEDHENLERFISLNPEYEKERELFLKTRLVPADVRFPGKKKLKKGSKKGLLIYYTSAAAAAVLVLGLFISNFFQRSGPADPSGMVPEKIMISKLQPIAAMEEYVPETSITLRKVNASAPVTPVENAYRDEFPVPQLDKLSTAHVTPSFEPFVSKYLISRYEGTESAALLLASLPDVEGQSGRTVVGRVLAGLFTNARDIVMEPADEVIDKGERDLSFWTLASLGIKGYNAMADRELSLEPAGKDETGKITYQLIENDEVVRPSIIRQEP